MGQLPLVPRAAAGDAARNDLAALGDEAAETTHVFVIDEVDLVRAELTNLPASKATPLDWLLSWGNGSPPLFARRRLERDVVLAALTFVAAERRRRGRNRCRRTARAALGAAHGKTLGVVGFGRIGRAMARRAQGFGMRVLYHDAVRADAGVERELNATATDLDTLLRQSDFVTMRISGKDLASASSSDS